MEAGPIDGSVIERVGVVMGEKKDHKQEGESPSG